MELLFFCFCFVFFRLSEIVVQHGWTVLIFMANDLHTFAFYSGHTWRSAYICMLPWSWLTICISRSKSAVRTVDSNVQKSYHDFTIRNLSNVMCSLFFTIVCRVTLGLSSEQSTGSCRLGAWDLSPDIYCWVYRACHRHVLLGAWDCHPTCIAWCVGFVTNMLSLGARDLSPDMYYWVRETCHQHVLLGAWDLSPDAYCWVCETCHPTRITGCVRLVTNMYLLGEWKLWLLPNIFVAKMRFVYVIKHMSVWCVY